MRNLLFTLMIGLVVSRIVMPAVEACLGRRRHDNPADDCEKQIAVTVPNVFFGT